MQCLCHPICLSAWQTPKKAGLADGATQQQPEYLDVLALQCRVSLRVQEEGPAVGSALPYLTSVRAEQPPSSVGLSVAICEMRVSPATHSAAQTMWQNLRSGTWHQMDLIG